MIIYDNKLYKIGLVWLDEYAESEMRQVDIVKFLKSCKESVKFPLPASHTIKIDLSVAADTIRDGLNKNTRYEIRRAESDGLSHAWNAVPDLTAINNFATFYHDFAAAKSGVTAISEKDLQKYAAGGLLAFSTVQKEGDTLVWHAYYLGSHTATLLHSASLFRSEESVATRQIIGRANRWHHWQDMHWLKEQGMTIYDFGGWYSGDDDPVLLQINRFKEGFGGTIVAEYNYFLAQTLKGALVLYLKKFLGKI